MRKLGLLTAAAALAAFVLGSAASRADPVTIDNFSFEDPAFAEGGFSGENFPTLGCADPTINVIPDWATTKICFQAVGVFHPPETTCPGPLVVIPNAFTVGDQIGFSNGGEISQ